MKLGKLLVLIGLCATSIILFTQTTPTTHAHTDTTHLLGHLEIDGSTDIVFFDGDIIYMGTGNILTVVDVSNPTNPTIIGKSDPLPNNILYIHVVGNVAYIADGHHVLITLDVSDPANPTIIRLFDTGYSSYTLTVVGNIAYATVSNDRLLTLDVSDPSNPDFIGVARMRGGIARSEVVGNTAYFLEDWVPDLITVDVSDPENMAVLDSVHIDGGYYGNDMSIVGNIAYIASGHGLIMVDVSNPANLTVLGSISPNDLFEVDLYLSATSVSIVGNIAYVGITAYGVMIIDVSDPMNPFYVDTIHADFTATNVHVANDLIYVTGWESGLYIFESPLTSTSTDAPSTPPTDESVPCPESGAWPAGCNPNLPPTSPSPSSPSDDSDNGNNSDCVIPPSGPWPPCATGGESNSTTPSSDSDCVIPSSGPWPPCATGGR